MDLQNEPNRISSENAPFSVRYDGPGYKEYQITRDRFMNSNDNVAIAARRFAYHATLEMEKRIQDKQ